MAAPKRISGSWFVRTLLVSLGFLSLFLGILGIFLPLLPTTPFLLLTALCFSRGSERCHRLLLAQPQLGQVIRDWEEEGVIRLRAKILCSFVFASSYTYLFFFRGVSLVLGSFLMLMAGSVLAFVWTRPASHAISVVSSPSHPE